MTSLEAATAWVDAWVAGWRTHDAERIAARYAGGETYRSHPFRAPEEGARQYAARVFAEEDPEPRVWFGKPIAEGDRAAVEWWAIVTEGGAPQTLAGTTVLRFDAAGLVVEHCDYWVAEAGEREPFDGWGGRAAAAG